VKKGIADVGFSNINHYSKYLYWQKFGYCPPEKVLGLVERLEAIQAGSYSKVAQAASDRDA